MKNWIYPGVKVLDGLPISPRPARISTNEPLLLETVLAARKEREKTRKRRWAAANAEKMKAAKKRYEKSPLGKATRRAISKRFRAARKAELIRLREEVKKLSTAKARKPLTD